MNEDYFRVGVITEPHGVKGEVKLFPTTDDVEHLRKVKEYFIPGREGMEAYTAISLKRQNDRFILKFREVEDRDMAEKLRKKDVYVDRAHAIPLYEDEYYVSDLEGLEVYEDGKLIGTLKEVMQTGANDVYSIERTDGSELLLPAIKQCILKVDIKGGRMDVSVMEGL